MLRACALRYSFCSPAPCIQRPNLQQRYPSLWKSRQFECETRIEETQVPQSVIAQRLKFLASRNEFIKELEHFQLHSIPSLYYQKSLFDISNLMETAQLSRQTKVDEQQAVLLGLKLFTPLTSEQIQLLKFQFTLSHHVVQISFLEAAITLVKQTNQFQDLLFVNFANNLFELLSDLPKRMRSLEEKLKELFNEIGLLFLKFDYLSESQPINIAHILGSLNDLIVTYSIKVPEIIHYQNTAHTFVRKYYEISPAKQNQLNVIDYKHFLYTLFLSQIRPQAMIQDIVDKFASQGIQYGSVNMIVDLMSMMLLYEIPCTENFLMRLKDAKKQRFSIVQMYVVLKCFEDAKVPLHEFSSSIFLDAVGHVQSDVHSSQESTEITMFARICNELFKTQFVTSKQSQERRNDRILTYVEKTVYRCQKDIQAQHILFIANVFNQNMRQPTLLIDVLHKRLDELHLDNTTASQFQEFLEITYNYFNQSYDILSLPLQPQAYPTQEYTEVVKALTHKIIEKDTIEELFPTLLKIFSLKCFTFEKSIILKVMNRPTTSLKDFHIVTRIMKEYKIPLNQRILDILIAKREENLVNLVEALYNLCLNYQLGDYENKIKDLAYGAISQLIADNEVFLVSHREIDDFLHTYIPQLNQPGFEAFQYIPMIVSQLGLKIEQDQRENLYKLYERTCKLWYEDTLVLNLILLNKQKIYNFPLYVECAENLLTCFDVTNNCENIYISGLLRDPKILYELVLSYLHQVDRVEETIQNEGLKLVGYLANLAYSHLTPIDLMLLQRLLGNNMKMYHPSLLTKLKNAKIIGIKNDEFITYASQFYVENESVKLLLINYLQTEDIILSTDLLQATQYQHISIDNIDEIFNSLFSEDKKKVIKQLLNHLLHCWDITQPITKIMKYARAQYDKQDQEFQCLYVLLGFLESNPKIQSWVKNHDEIYELSLDSLSLDAKLKEKLDELLKKLDVIGRSTLIGENDAVYYKSMITEFDQNQQATYKIAHMKKSNTEDLQIQDKLLLFLTKPINFSRETYRYQLLDYLLNWATIVQLDIEEYFDTIPNTNQSDSIALLKKDDDYLDFIVSVSTTIQNVADPLQAISANVTESELNNTFASMKITDVRNNMRRYFQYCNQGDLCTTSKGKQLTPLKIIQQLPLCLGKSQVYVINYKKWTEKYQTQHQQMKVLGEFMK